MNHYNGEPDAPGALYIIRQMARRKSTFPTLPRVRAQDEPTPLFACRLALRLTQADVAKALGVHQSYVSQLERGSGKPAAAIFARLVRFHEG